MRILTSFVALFIVVNMSGQLPCSTTEVMNNWFSAHPELKQNFQKHQDMLYRADAQRPKDQPVPAQQGALQSVSIYTIPVVFHVLHQGGPENITDAQVKDAIRVLNEDYNALNADTANVVHEFKKLIGNTQFKFVLATRDPNGNCTNGIIRHFDARTNWMMVNFNDYVYTWNPVNYLNIYTVKSISGGNAAGYTFLPGSGVPSSADAIVILSNYVGAIGTGMAGLSRALSHEVGHWFSLEHVWGSTNSPGVACGDDGVSDTPVTMGYTTCNLSFSNICDPNVVENVQNYMEYAYCQNMFTQGQSYRMQTAIQSSMNGRDHLSTNANLVATGVLNPVTSGCVPGFDIAAPAGTMVCTGRPLAVACYTYNANPQTMQWSTTGSGVVTNISGYTTTVTFPLPGQYTVNCLVNGNQNKTLVVTAVDQNNKMVGAYPESFESGGIPPNWTVISEGTAAYDWQISSLAGKNGANSVVAPGEVMPGGVVTVLETPAYDFLHNPVAVFTFYYAYARKSGATSDQFRVLASKDCGSTWTPIWVPSMTSLAAGSGGIHPQTFFPFSEWVKYDLTAHPAFGLFKSEENVKIRFEFTEDYGNGGHQNRFYLDDINFDAQNVMGVASMTDNRTRVSVFPNPAKDVFSVEVVSQSSTTASIRIVNLAGQDVIATRQIHLTEGKQQIDFSEDLAPGIYMVLANVSGVTTAVKLVVR